MRSTLNIRQKILCPFQYLKNNSDFYTINNSSSVDEPINIVVFDYKRTPSEAILKFESDPNFMLLMN